jgi:hypothetical protein
VKADRRLVAECMNRVGHPEIMRLASLVVAMIRCLSGSRVIWIGTTVLALGAGTARALETADVYVSPTGQDAATGAADAPVATLRRALDHVRDIRAAEPSRATPIVVEVADGRYELAAMLVITPADSGTERSPTVIRAAAGARPAVSGGRVVRGWAVTDVDGQQRWSVELPAVKTGGWRFSQLFVDDQRRFRPVLPATGWHTIAGTVEPSSAPVEKGRPRGHDRFAFAGDDLRPDWANRGDVEVLAAHRWAMSRLPIGSIDADPSDASTRILTLAGRTWVPAEWCSFHKGNRFLVENVREALGEPGSWYLDRPTGSLTYCPREGETPETTVVIAPALDRLVEVRGDVKSGAHVAHITFEGLTFLHGNWTIPAEGQVFFQGDVNVGGSIVATGAKHVAFVDCGARHVGRYAFEFGAGCTDCTLERCELVDLGGGGVLIGTAGGPYPWGFTDAGGWRDASRPEGAGMRVERIAIRDCTIAHGGRVHPAALGVWIGHAAHCTVEHCDIHDFTYSGVSVGWTWGYGESHAHHNCIRSNHIHHIGQGVLSDMGAVYFLGVSPGTVVEGNHIHDVASKEYGGWGLYTDEGSTGIVIRKNLVYRTSSGGFHQHYGRDNLIEGNVFAMARDWQIQRTRIEHHTSFRFEKNIVWWTTDVPLVKGDWTKGLVTKANCYWHGGKPVEFPDGKDLAARQAQGQDEGSIVADPRFKDPDHGDFALAADSPARALGLEPLDPAAAGRRTPRTLTSALPPVPTIWLRTGEPPAR